MLTAKVNFLILVPPLILVFSEKKICSKIISGFILGSVLQYTLFCFQEPYLPVKYSRFLLSTESSSYGSWPHIMYSVQYLFLRLNFSLIASLILSGFLYAVFLRFVVYLRRKGFSCNLLYAFVFLMAPFFMYHIISQDMVILLLGFGLLFAELKRLNYVSLFRWTALFVVSFSLIDLVKPLFNNFVFLPFALCVYFLYRKVYLLNSIKCSS